MLFAINSKAEENNIKYYSEDSGILSLMYHRFDENKYPSTNIQMDIFKVSPDHIRATHAHPLHSVALASVLYVLVRV